MGMRVLVVDDDEGVTNLLRSVLSYDGFSVDIAHDGADALAQVTAMAYDLMLSDLRMAGMDGLALIRAIRAIRPDLPVLLVTGYATEEVRQAAREAGALGVIEKPFNLLQLRSTVRAVWDPPPAPGV